MPSTQSASQSVPYSIRVSRCGSSSNVSMYEDDISKKSGAESFADLLNTVRISGNKSPKLHKKATSFVPPSSIDLPVHGDGSKTRRRPRKAGGPSRRRSVSADQAVIFRYRASRKTEPFNPSEKLLGGNKEKPYGHPNRTRTRSLKTLAPYQGNRSTGRRSRKAGGSKRRRSVSADPAVISRYRASRKTEPFDANETLDLDGDKEKPPGRPNRTRTRSVDNVESLSGLGGVTTPLPPVSYMISTKEYDGCSISNGARPHKIVAIDQIIQSKLEADAFVNVSDLKWVEKVSPFRQGSYTGAIDRKARPHGKGTWVSGEEKLFGWWRKGVFIPNEYISRRLNEPGSIPNEDISRCGSELDSSTSTKETELKFSEPTPTSSSLKCAPSPRSSTESIDNNKPSFEQAAYKPGKACLASKGFRCDYSLGEAARSRSDMIKHRTTEQVFQAVNSLQKHDFAFIKRSDGSYSYTILAFRSLEPLERSSSCAGSLEECMAFVVCDTGSIKMLKKGRWVKNVRLVSVEGLGPPRTRTRNKQMDDNSCPNYHKDEWVPPSIISFIPTRNFDDGMSKLYHKDEWVPPSIVSFISRISDDGMSIFPPFLGENQFYRSR